MLHVARAYAFADRAFVAVVVVLHTYVCTYIYVRGMWRVVAFTSPAFVRTHVYLQSF